MKRTGKPMATYLGGGIVPRERGGSYGLEGQKKETNYRRELRASNAGQTPKKNHEGEKNKKF